jgi:hypothetical protein
VVSFLQTFRPKSYSSPPCVLQARPSHRPWLRHPNIKRRSVQNYEAPHYASFSSIQPLLLDPNIHLITLFSKSLTLCSYLIVRYQVSHPYKTTGNTVVWWGKLSWSLDPVRYKSNNAHNTSSSLTFRRKSVILTGFFFRCQKIPQKISNSHCLLLHPLQLTFTNIPTPHSTLNNLCNWHRVVKQGFPAVQHKGFIFPQCYQLYQLWITTHGATPSYLITSRDSSVSKVTRLRAQRPGFVSRQP